MGILIGGDIYGAGNLRADHLAVWTPESESWSTLGSGFNGPVYCLLPLPDGSLIAGGSFTLADNLPALGIARWNGQAWTDLGAGVAGSTPRVNAVALLPSGDLVVGGRFSVAGAISVANIAQWNGSNWQSSGALGTGLDGAVHCLLLESTGDLIVGGEFVNAGGLPANRIARWDGLEWSPLGAGLNDTVYSLLELPSGELAVGGEFDRAGLSGAPLVAKWNGQQWSPMGLSLSAACSCNVRSLALLPDGRVVAAGSFATEDEGRGVAVFSSGDWETLGGGLTYDGHSVLPLFDEIYVGGRFHEAGGAPATGVARLNGVSWSPLATGTNAEVNDLSVTSNGEILATGAFTSIEGVPANRVARWNGEQWSALGAGINYDAYIVREIPGGDILVGGNFSAAGGITARHLARFNGQSWSSLGNANNSVDAIVAMPDGSIVIGGWFSVVGGVNAQRIARWDGNLWSPLGSGLSSGGSSPAGLYALCLLPTNELVAGGLFSTAGGVPARNIARWDGFNWHPLGTGTNAETLDLAVLQDGSLVAGGFFRRAGGVLSPGVARWDGAQWHSLSSGFSPDCCSNVRALGVLEGGDLIAAGEFQAIDQVPASNIARWDGTTWHPLGAGISGVWAETVCVLPEGDIAVGGRIGAAGDFASAFMARYGCSNGPGDVDGDGHVNLPDLARLLTAFGSCTGDEFFEPRADFDESGCVDLLDVSVLLASFGL